MRALGTCARLPRGPLSPLSCDSQRSGLWNRDAKGGGFLPWSQSHLTDPLLHPLWDQDSSGAEWRLRRTPPCFGAARISPHPLSTQSPLPDPAAHSTMAKGYPRHAGGRLGPCPFQPSCGPIKVLSSFLPNVPVGCLSAHRSLASDTQRAVG